MKHLGLARAVRGKAESPKRFPRASANGNRPEPNGAGPDRDFRLTVKPASGTPLKTVDHAKIKKACVRNSRRYCAILN
jgi:hypothetical protein